MARCIWGDQIDKLQKLLEKGRNNPKAVRFVELDKILVAAGFVRRQSGKGTSHYFYKKEEKTIFVPFRQPHILRIYVEKAIELIGDSFEDEEA
jgi:predicted RNA binding protein YcfA (HicA-like mRNA interferase family)